jgi:glutaminyl-peptide cyclotransferase
MPTEESIMSKKKWRINFLFSLILLTCIQSIFASNQYSDSSKFDSIPIFGYKVINTYPHDSTAFTQGLVYENEILYEGTGLYGSSTLRQVDLKTGRILKRIKLNNSLFGEGVAVWENQLIQLTWQSGLGLVYDKYNLTKIGYFSYQTEGWGITSDGERLIMSDGTETLHFLDARTFAEEQNVKVVANGMPVQGLNELEYINGDIFANVWPTNWIVIISPDSGNIKGYINLQGILDQTDGKKVMEIDVLNGIAYDKKNKRIFVTGKLWPKLFEIQLIAKNGS